MPHWMQHLLEYVAFGVTFAIAYHSFIDNPDAYIGFRPRRRFRLRRSLLSLRTYRPVRSISTRLVRRR
ncbi:MAG: hypothetical protein IGR76_12985 [Synechococcales cyanobacterium T60_A2020_003]|nr:hypothetical protein [Synechococcales cyanobacterium T60_A2020_003]